MKHTDHYFSKIIVVIYMCFYMLAFHLLESRVNYKIHIIRSNVDYSIPFCEYFIVPYILWFFFVGITVFWFMFKNKEHKEYLQLILSLGIGMTVFIVVSWLYPNGHFLRPVFFARDNIFVDLVKILYSIDTPTNILPSIHVYNTVAVFLAIVRSKQLQKSPLIVGSSLVLSILIILSTMFLKQHTIIDVIAAVILNLVVYLFIYMISDSRVWLQRKIYSSIVNS